MRAWGQSTVGQRADRRVSVTVLGEPDKAARQHLEAAAELCRDMGITDLLQQSEAVLATLTG